MQHRVRPIFLVLLALAAIFTIGIYRAGQIKVWFIYNRTKQQLESQLLAKHLAWGSPVFIRIFKQEKQMEVWLANDSHYELFATYPICSYSGHLGPKLSEGDRQAPEGFYEVKSTSMVPGSAFHLSFDIGFPNEFDRSHGRTGSHLMVHGGCVSAGCYAMTDDGIDHVYVLMLAAFHAGQQEIPVHIFPFRLTTDELAKHSDSKWLEWWKQLEPGYDAFESSHTVPKVSIRNGAYYFDRGP